MAGEDAITVRKILLLVLIESLVAITMFSFKEIFTVTRDAIKESFRAELGTFGSFLNSFNNKK